MSAAVLEMVRSEPPTQPAGTGEVVYTWGVEEVEVATPHSTHQLMFGEGPISALISPSTGAIKPKPAINVRTSVDDLIRADTYHRCLP